MPENPSPSPADPGEDAAVALDWLEDARATLVKLEVGPLDPARAWQFVVLAARLYVSPAGPALSSSMIGRLSEATRVAAWPTWPDLRELLGRLTDAMADEAVDAAHRHGDLAIAPWAPGAPLRGLLGELLEIDGAAVALAGVGQREVDVAWLIQCTLDVIGLWPSCFLALRSFARARLRALGEHAPVAQIWHAICDDT